MHHIHRILPTNFRFAEKLLFRRNAIRHYTHWGRHEQTSAMGSHQDGHAHMPTENVPGQPQYSSRVGSFYVRNAFVPGGKDFLLFQIDHCHILPAIRILHILTSGEMV